jgi:hypothetical protein
LQGSLLIETEQPGPSLQQHSCLSRPFQSGTGSLHKGCRIMDRLPGMRAPRANTVFVEPTSHGALRDRGKRAILSHAASHLGSAPPRERDVVLARQATRDGGDLCADLRGRNASAPLAWARQQASAS